MTSGIDEVCCRAMHDVDSLLEMRSFTLDMMIVGYTSRCNESSEMREMKK
jgi:hypothetical protein